MTKLDSKRKQEITVGAFPIIGSGFIKFLHGFITTSWVALDVVNLAADHLPKKKERFSYTPRQIPVEFENNLITSKTTINS